MIINDDNVNEMIRDIYVDDLRVKPYTVVRNNLRKLRLKCGLSQDQLALKTGVNQSLIHRIESGKGNLTCENLVLFARFFGCDIADLLDVDLPRNTSIAADMHIDKLNDKINRIKAIIDED